MVAYIDEFKDRFRVGPICRVLAASLDCGFITGSARRFAHLGSCPSMGR